jgi:trichohyalin
LLPSEDREIDQLNYEKIMRKYILRHEVKNLEKSLKEKEYSYEIYLVEKKEELKYLVNQLNDLRKRKDTYEEDLKKLNDRNNIIKKNKDELINMNKEKYKLKIDEEKKTLNKRFNELKRKLDEENLDINNYYKEHEGNMKELQEEHQKIDEKLELIYKKKKEFAESFDTLEEENKKMVELIKKLESDFEEKHFFEKIIEINNKTNKETVCLICAEKRREIVNMPCKHITMCSECYFRVTSNLNFRVCFICNRFIERTIKAIVENI